MMVTYELNPLLAHLLKRRRIDVVDEVRPLIGLLAADIPIMLILLGLPLGSTNVRFGLIAWGSIYLILALIPAMIGYACASATSSLIASHNFELLALTNISNATILWSYVIATLYRWRKLLIVAIGLAPVSVMLITLIWTSWQNYYGFMDVNCVYAPLGVEVCEPGAFGASVDIGTQIVRGIQVSLTFLGVAAFIAGMALLMAVVGSLFGFVLKPRWLALFIMGWLGFMVGVLVAIVIVPELVLGTFIAQNADFVALLYVLIAVPIPYFLTHRLSRRASPLVRSPA